MSEWVEALECRACGERIHVLLAEIRARNVTRETPDTTFLPWNDNSETLTRDYYELEQLYACDCSEWRALPDSEPPESWPVRSDD